MTAARDERELSDIDFDEFDVATRANCESRAELVTLATHVCAIHIVINHEKS